MVNITDGTHEFSVTEGAFEDIFKKQGYVEVAEDKAALKSELEAQADSLDDKPVSMWTKQELKAYCDAHGISLEDVTSTDEVRKRVLEHQEQQLQE